MLPTRAAQMGPRLVDEMHEDRALARQVRSGHLVRDYRDGDLVAVVAVDDPNTDELLTVTAIPVAGATTPAPRPGIPHRRATGGSGPVGVRPPPHPQRRVPTSRSRSGAS
ncbi:MAG: hypothetical protein ACRD0P_20745 [Stackebrandtia sp.]